MKKTFVALTILSSLAICAAGSERRDADIERIQTASTVLSQIMSAPDRAIPDSIMSGAKCIAIMPSMLKASFVFGANYGKGVATCRTETWLEHAGILQADRRQLRLPGRWASL